MSRKNLLGNVLLLITAVIWGSSFVAQTVGGTLGTFSFNGIRSFIGSGALLVLIIALRLITKKKTKTDKTLLVGGIACGCVLFVASTCQQLGMNLGVSSGKSGFITALYIVMVPILYILLKKPVSKMIWVSVALAVVGLYLLCLGGDASFDMADPIGSIIGSLSFGLGELATLVCAVVFAIHIIIVDHFAPKVDCVKLSCIQFFVVGVLSLPMMLLVEHPSLSGIGAQTVPLLYSGLMSCGVAYTLQMIGQRMTKPTVASLLMSLESVFAVIAGMLILSETHSVFEYIGCVLVFGAVIIAQLPFGNNDEKTENEG
jgi:drug/metabolite transporter (DMT)-like permease